MNNPHVLTDGSRVAVIGGGPSGSFFSIFALDMAEMIGLDLDVTIYEPRDFKKPGPAGCNMCGGIISELLVQMLAVEGINLPESLVQRGINSYELHTNYGSVSIATPALEKTIAAICRGGGPRKLSCGPLASFDSYLLSLACEKGAVHRQVRIDRVDYSGEKPVLYSKDEQLQEADLVVGAFGANKTLPEVSGDAGFQFSKPLVAKTAIAEIEMGDEAVMEHFGSSINLFLLPKRDLKFAAIIPKGTYATVCILGKNIDKNTVEEFLSHPVVAGVLPRSGFDIRCQCFPVMNVGVPRQPFTDRIVLCGDSGSTRLFKDGIGAAYLMGKAAAITAVFQGVSASDFRKIYLPVYKSLIVDNWFGRILFLVTDMFKRTPLLTKIMLEAVRGEQGDPDDPKILSSILWDMFTGNERYKNIFFRTFKFRMHQNLFEGLERVILNA